MAAKPPPEKYGIADMLNYLRAAPGADAGPRNG